MATKTIEDTFTNTINLGGFEYIAAPVLAGMLQGAANRGISYLGRYVQRGGDAPINFSTRAKRFNNRLSLYKPRRIINLKKKKPGKGGKKNFLSKVSRRLRRHVRDWRPRFRKPSYRARFFRPSKDKPIYFGRPRYLSK